MSPSAPGPAYRVDGELVAASAFYAVACEPGNRVVVEACAGAGKTWMLVSRMVRALLAGAQPQEILAITFTRKAAGEMRARLAEWLHQWRDGAASHAERVQALSERGLSRAAAEAAAPRLGRLHAELAAQGRRVEVRTFHSWFGQLLRAAPLELLARFDWHAGMAQVEEDGTLYGDAWRRLLVRVHGDAPLAADLRGLVVRHGRHRTEDWLHAAWFKRGEIARWSGAGQPQEPSGPEPLAAARALLLSLLPLAAQLSAAQLPSYDKLADQALAATEQAEHLSDALVFKRVHDVAMTQGGTPRQRFTSAPALAQLQDAVAAIRAAQAAYDSARDHHAVRRLAAALAQEYAALKRERALLDMGDLETLGVALLADGAFAAWAQERLDARVRHLLIDEFQDTSPIQWQALKPWLEGHGGVGGGQALSLFVVGDPKQSIYRFRGAEPRVFAAAQALVQALGGHHLQCDHTRRSAPAVLDSVNAVFGPLAARGDYPGFRPHTTARVAEPGLPEGLFALPRVETAKPDRDKKDAQAPLVWRDSLTEPLVAPQTLRGAEEARRVAEAIAALLASGHPADEVQVLARTRAVLAQVEQALRVLGVPHAPASDTPLADEPEAADLLAVLDALASPAHDLALARVLKSPLIGADDAALMALAQATAGRAWSDTLVDEGERLPAPLPWAAALWRGWRDAQTWLPPHDLLDRVLHDSDAIARTMATVPPERTRHARAVIEALLAQSLAVDGGRALTPYRFVRALRQGAHKLVLSPPPGAVQLHTIHGAKGLEADVVFLVGTEPGKPDSRSEASASVAWEPSTAGPQRAAFYARGDQAPPWWQAEADSDATADVREQLNALYVAMTRARRCLVVSATARSKGQFQTWWDLVHPHAKPWPLGCGLDAPPTAAARPAPAAPPAPAVWVPPALGPAPMRWAPQPAPEDDPAARTGRAFHRLMQWLCAAPPGDDAAFLARALPAAAQEFALAAAQGAHALAAAKQVAASPAFARFRGGDPAAPLAFAASEVVLPWRGQVLRLDRVVQLADGCWWVLDYKLDSAPQTQPPLVAQLGRYRAALAALVPGEAVQAAFVTARGEVLALAPADSPGQADAAGG